MSLVGWGELRLVRFVSALIGAPFNPATTAAWSVAAVGATMVAIGATSVQVHHLVVLIDHLCGA
jgi:hypothetical protein